MAIKLVKVFVPPTMEQGSYVTQLSTEWNTNYRQSALECYNSARSHDGLPPLRRMPKGTKYVPYTIKEA